jgi:hypothetical protein
MGDRFNTAIDTFNAAFWRLLELPLFVLISFMIISFLLTWQSFLFIQKKRGKQPAKYTSLKWIGGVFLVITIALIVDHKIVSTLNEVRQQESKDAMNFKGFEAYDKPAEQYDEAEVKRIEDYIRSDSTWLASITEKAEKQGKDIEAFIHENAIYHYNQERLRRIKENSIINNSDIPIRDKMQQIFGKSELNEKQLHDAIHLVAIKIEKPLIHGFLAIVDLTHPKVNIEITPKKKEKYLTSVFAKEQNCLIAINGETGESPGPDGPLGRWTGNWISKGKAILLEDNPDRPFLAFSKEKKGKYFPEKIVDAKLSDDKYNTIFGRFDILIDGKNLDKEKQYGQPRTIMGINKEGTKLYLFVIDGRQPGYSMGIGLKEAGDILRLFGASDAMACDQGGTSCMFVKDVGIVNRPANLNNDERVVYSHFGISISE